MNVLVNGEQHELDQGALVSDVLVLLGRDRFPRGLAVAINGHVVPRAEWAERELADQDKVEVLQAIGGG